MRLSISRTPEESKQFADWLAQAHGYDKWSYPGPYFGYGLVDDDDTIKAAVVVEPFISPGSYLLNTAFDGPRIMWHRSLVGSALELPFTDILNARRVSVIVDDRYTRVIQVAEALGFKPEGRLSCMFEDRDGVLLGMTKSDVTKAS